MSADQPKIAGNPPAHAAEVTKMTAIAEAQYLIRDIAGPVQGYAQVQEMLNTVARVSGLGHRRLRGIWNNEARAIRSEEMDALRRAAAARRFVAEEEDARAQLKTAFELLKRIEASLEASPHAAREVASYADDVARASHRSLAGRGDEQ